MNYAVNFTITHKFGVEPLFQEGMAIPLQQLSATVATDGKMTAYERNYMKKLLPLKTIKEKYDPNTTDSIKWNSKFNRQYLQNHQAEFFKVWASVLPKNFKTYVESYLLETYYFWKLQPISPRSSMYNDTHTDYEGDYVESVKDKFNLKVRDLFPKTIQTKLESFYHDYSRFIGEGLSFWILCFLSLILIYKKQYKYLLVTVPLFTLWLSLMLATPVNSSLRYTLPFVFIMPILVSFIIPLNNHK